MSPRQVHFILLYVKDPLKSSAFYTQILGVEPLELHPTFAMHELPGGMKLGLWQACTVEPSFTGELAGGMEVAFIERQVDALYEQWRLKGLEIAQAPTDMDFGRTFVALDPDGHRLRVFWPSEASA